MECYRPRDNRSAGFACHGTWRDDVDRDQDRASREEVRR